MLPGRHDAREPSPPIRLDLILPQDPSSPPVSPRQVLIFSHLTKNWPIPTPPVRLVPYKGDVERVIPTAIFHGALIESRPRHVFMISQSGSSAPATAPVPAPASSVSSNGHTRKYEEVESVTIRFAGDSGDGMQLAGTQFTNTSALAGNDIATFPDFPAEIRAPAGTLACRPA